MPGPSGLDLIKQLRRERPALPLLVVSMHPAAQFARRALSAGALGYLTKDSAPEDFVTAIENARARTPLCRPRRERNPASLAGKSARAAARLAFGSGVSGLAASRIRAHGVRYRTRARIEREDGQHLSDARARKARHADQRRADAVRDRKPVLGQLDVS